MVFLKSRIKYLVNALCSFLQKKSVFCWSKQAAEGEKEEVNKGMSARKRAVSTEQNRRRRGVRERVVELGGIVCLLRK